MAENVNIETMTDPELALLYGQQYQQMMLCQQNIRNIETELLKRKERHNNVEKGLKNGATDKQ